MPIEKQFTSEDIQELIDNNKEGKYGPRNTALIFALSYWGLERKEISLLSLGSVMDDSGQWYRLWPIPPEYSHNGEGRELMTADHVIPALDAYSDWLIANNVGRTNLHTYRGFDPDMKLFVNDKFEPFALTPRNKPNADGSVSYQTRTLDDKIKSFIAATSIEGATLSTFRDSWLKSMYEAGCQYNELMDVSGIKRKETIDAKIRPYDKELEGIFNKVFNRMD
jgi:hypothetical protein